MHNATLDVTDLLGNQPEVINIARNRKASDHRNRQKQKKNLALFSDADNQECLSTIRISHFVATYVSECK